MAGRKQFDVNEALDRAMTVFWERGYAETSIEQISAATGLGKGSLYGTFGGKPELFRLALDRYADTFGEQYEAALSVHPNDPSAAVREFFEVVLQRIANPLLPGGCLIALSAAASPTLDEASRQRVAQLLDRQRVRIRSALGPTFTDDEADELALFIVSTNQALAIMDRAGFSAADLHAIVETAVRSVRPR